MFRKIALAGCAAALLFGAIPAQAKLNPNTTWSNGSARNALIGNGIQGNGRSLQGDAINGSDMDRAQAPRVVGVELPDSGK